MAVFSTNQNRHFYVGKLGSTSSHVTTLANPGDIKVAHVGEGNAKQIYFEYVNKKGEVIKSDYITVKNLDYVKAFKASDMATPLTKKKVTLASDVNSGNPVTGQDYVLRIVFRQWLGAGEEHTYIKDASVHATAAMTSDKKEFYKEMVKQLNLAFSREIGATKTSNPYLEFSAGTATQEDGIYITEKPQEYEIGREAQERVIFDVQPTTIFVGGDDVIWGTVTDTTPAKYVEDSTSQATPKPLIPNPAVVVGTNAIGNGPKIAEMEWFYLGERGDQYRYVGWPNVVITEGLADASKQYNVLEFHHAFTDTGVNSYRSEKDITIAVPLGAAGHLYDDINALIGEINYQYDSTGNTTLLSTLS